MWIETKVDSVIWGYILEWIQLFVDNTKWGFDFLWIHFEVDSIIWGFNMEGIPSFVDSHLWIRKVGIREKWILSDSLIFFHFSDIREIPLKWSSKSPKDY